MLEKFIKSYWNFYLDLEDQFLDTRRYVEFDTNNRKTFSAEYLKLYQSIGSEIDVIGKEIANYFNPSFEKYDINHKNIYQWFFEVQKAFPNIQNEHLYFYSTKDVQPFAKCEIIPQEDPITFIKKDNSPKLKLGNKKEVPSWWKNYNNVKHQRVALVVGTSYFKQANQANVINALAALYLLEIHFIDVIREKEPNPNIFEITPSKLFKKL